MFILYIYMCVYIIYTCIAQFVTLNIKIERKWIEVNRVTYINVSRKSKYTSITDH